MYVRWLKDWADCRAGEVYWFPRYLALVYITGGLAEETADVPRKSRRLTDRAGRAETPCEVGTAPDGNPNAAPDPAARANAPRADVIVSHSPHISGANDTGSMLV